MPKQKDLLHSIPPENHALYIDKEDHIKDKRPKCKDQRQVATKCFARTEKGRCDILCDTSLTEDERCPFYKSNNAYLSGIKKYGNGIDYSDPDGHKTGRRRVV